ncbi:MAG TPA: HupE/UreJ family protein [Leucothrix mucor]|nr:HupE/UreJ family protein [Leucothrix mucor]
MTFKFLLKLPLSSLIAIALLLSFSHNATADTVKPALVEISANTKGHVTIEVRASIEALLTGINGRYKNTKESPNAKKYDLLRKLPEQELGTEFQKFSNEFLTGIVLKNNVGDIIPLQIKSTKIPEPGYTKVPRISLITLDAQLDRETQSLQWYYPLKFGDNAVRLMQVNKEAHKWHWSEWQWLRNDQFSEAFSLTEIFTKRPLHKVIIEYIVIGFEHIIPMGLDHILFILGIFLLNTKFKPLIQQVTLFTIAHTITLGLSINGIFTLPPIIVEPLIALSIAYIGIENIFAKSLNKMRLLIVFLFGLIHGMGFASVLADFNMPENTFITTLISFNVGVELGQLSVIALAYFSITFWFKNKDWYRNIIVIPSSLLIAIFGLYWAVDRLNFL